MEKKTRTRRMTLMIIAVAVLSLGMLFASPSAAVAGGSDQKDAQGLVDNARVTLGDFLRDPNYSWFRDNLDRAKGVLIFPQVLKGGFVVGGSGGTGVFMARDEKTGNWNEPAFYTIGSVTFGLQIGGESAQVVMLAMSQKAVDSLLSSSFKLGGDVSVALGPIGGGAKASADIPAVTGDFVSFAKSKGLYAGLNLEGSVIAVRDGLNVAYYGKDVRPADIIANRVHSTGRTAAIRESLKCKC
ncbi:MAG: lipid-binding SYLF domain-containing protein [Thermodesulfobacteriota bacterium]